MSSEICGNCANFNPKPGEKFFNCTSATHAGVKYGMQVRPDTRSCDGFTPLKASPAPKPAPKSAQLPARARPRPVGLCPWGRLILVVALVIAILLFSWLAYTCATRFSSGPAPTPTPTPTPNPIVEPTPTPMPAFIYKYPAFGQWALAPDRAILLYSPGRGPQHGINSAPPGTSFVWFYATVTNTSTSTFSIGPGAFWLNDSTGYQYGPAGHPYYYPWRYDNQTLNPGQSVQGEVLFVVPDFATDVDVNYVIEPGSVPPVMCKWRLPQ